jgi:hypothetical protein
MNWFDNNLIIVAAVGLPLVLLLIFGALKTIVDRRRARQQDRDH